MTLEQARQVLGLGPTDDPADHVDALSEARERLAAMVRDAPNDTIALRYQESLQEYDRAMAALREEAERKRKEKVAPMMALVPGSVTGEPIDSKRGDFLKESPPSTPVSDAPPHEPAPEAAEPAAEGQAVDDPMDDETAGSSGLRFALYATIFILIGGAGGGWLYFHMEAEREARLKTELIFLEGVGGKLVEARRWDEARLAFGKIEGLDPGSEVALRGLRSIEVGMREEQEQFVGYWSGEALAAFEAGRLEDAREAADKVIKRYPKETEVVALRKKIGEARRAQLRSEAQEAVQAAIDEKNWEAAGEAVMSFSLELPGDELIVSMTKSIEDAKEVQRQEHERAKELAAAAQLRDQGEFDPEVLEWMREAVALFPDDPEIRALYEKVASYSRTIQIPGDIPTLKEALAQARDRDRLVLAEGTFEAGLAVNVAVQLEGAGEGKTILQSQAASSPALTFGPKAKGATVTGVLFRQEGFDASENRYPVVQVRAGEVNFTNCVFRDGSGHGLEVIDGGRIEASQCLFEGNGWDGVAARGSGSRMVVRESRANANVGHGFEAWDEAVASIQDCIAKGNARNGILIDSAADGLNLAGNEVMGNREYGILLAAGASGVVSKNSSYANLLGGMLVRFASISVEVEGNRLESNSGPGLILEQGLRPEIYQGNTARKNRGTQVMSGARFSESE